VPGLPVELVRRIAEFVPSVRDRLVVASGLRAITNNLLKSWLGTTRKVWGLV
jgi:hypothetical protein